MDKASKLEGRNTAQGLIGVIVKGNCASMVELNCETDFVARNAQFHELLNEVAIATHTAGSNKSLEGGNEQNCVAYVKKNLKQGSFNMPNIQTVCDGFRNFVDPTQ